jgi:hypothetical protein
MIIERGVVCAVGLRLNHTITGNCCVAVEMGARAAVRGALLKMYRTNVKGTAFTCYEDAAQIRRGEMRGYVDRPQR